MKIYKAYFEGALELGTKYIIAPSIGRAVDEAAAFAKSNALRITKIETINEMPLVAKWSSVSFRNGATCS